MPDLIDHVKGTYTEGTNPSTTIYLKFAQGPKKDTRTAKIDFIPDVDDSVIHAVTVVINANNSGQLQRSDKTYTINTDPYDPSTIAQSDMNLYTATYQCYSEALGWYEDKVHIPFVPPAGKAALDTLFQLSTTVDNLYLKGASKKTFMQSFLSRMN